MTITALVALAAATALFLNIVVMLVARDASLKAVDALKKIERLSGVERGQT